MRKILGVAIIAVALLFSGNVAGAVPNVDVLRDALLFEVGWERAPRVFFGMDVESVQATLGQPDVASTFEGLVEHSYGDLRIVYASGRAALFRFPAASPALLAATFPTDAPQWREYPNSSGTKCVAGTVRDWRGRSVPTLYWYVNGFEIFGARDAVLNLGLLGK